MNAKETIENLNKMIKLESELKKLAKGIICVDLESDCTVYSKDGDFIALVRGQHMKLSLRKQFEVMLSNYKSYVKTLSEKGVEVEILNFEDL